MKRVLSILLSVVVVFGCISCLTITNVNATSVVENAISWAIAIANDNSHGYSQSSRWGPDYDCSSLVISAFRAAGCDTGNATYTGNMKSQFTAHGFQWIPWSQIGGTGNLQRGDILLNENSHTEIYLGNNQNVGAHSNRGYPQTGDQTGTEVSVSGYYYHPWDGVLRYAGGSTPCTCSEDYAGDYIVNTNSQPLTMRSGHGTGYGVVTSIPKGSQVYVSKSDGDWAHVEWNGYNGYCSMSYLKKLENKNYWLHVWFSDTGMGDAPSEFYTGNRYYLCYELIDETTGRRVNETSNISYSATEKIKNSSGTIFEHTYNNSDNNWISFVCDDEDTYSGTVTISGDIGLSCSVSFTAWTNTAPQIKTWAWEGDDANEIDCLSPGKTVGLSYLIRDKNTGKNLNDVTTYWTQGNGYTVTIEIYSPSGILQKSQSFKNNDCVWIEFQPSTLGNYKMIIKVSGNLSGTQEKTFTSVEKDHVYGIWQTTKNATCTKIGAKECQCIFCGYTETQTIPATGHTEVVDKAVAPSCTNKGLTEGKRCSVCNSVLVEQNEIKALGHSAEKGWTTISTSYTGTITQVKYCTECREIVETREVVDSSITSDPTVTATDTTTTATESTEYEPVETTVAEPVESEATSPSTTVATEDESKLTSTTASDDETEPSEPSKNAGVLGDVNGDGKVNVKDATLIQKAAAKIIELTDEEKLRADVNADNKNNVKDATAIQKFAAKIETGFPIGEPIVSKENN